jgi:hypothetical protein
LRLDLVLERQVDETLCDGVQRYHDGVAGHHP